MALVMLSTASLLDHGANSAVLRSESTEDSVAAFSPKLLQPLLFVKPSHQLRLLVGPLFATREGFLR